MERIAKNYFKSIEQKALTLWGITVNKVYLGPSSLQIFLPAPCNHNCLFCVTNATGEKRVPNDALTYADLLRIIDDVVKLGTKTLIFLSHGEPLLFSELIDVIKYAKFSSQGRLNIRLITNGTLITEEMADFFIKYRIGLRFSIHAATSDTWVKIHNPDKNSDFDNLKRIIKKIADSNKCEVAILHVINKLNLCEIEEMCLLPIELNVREISFGRFHYFPEFRLTNIEAEKVAQILSSIAPVLSKHKIKHNIESYINYVLKPDTGFSENESLYSRNRCYAGWFFSNIEPSGNL